MKRQAKQPKIFDTDRRIKLGIWGLGRGMSFYSTCKALNIDVVAGCDYNEHMRKGFLQHNPGAFVSADADEFLAQPFDAVLLATFCPSHALDAIRCLKAGKHVLSEVTSFFTMAEGVQLVEEVDKSGLVYNLAENYPFSAENMYLANRWKEGLFGDLMYAEYEYVHECRSLAYTYIDGLPVQPGNTVHSWRSWLNFHYYCTHSLGPIMVITKTRPTRVVALPGKQSLAGYLTSNRDGMGGITPSLINMSNGAVVRNLMGATTNDTHVQRLWGTLGSAECNVGKRLQLRLGASGGSPKLEVIPTWDQFGKLAATMGHGGGDFWVLYYFARQIFTGEPAPFDIYSASDVTIPGILAVRSSLEGGKPYDVPDFRNKAERDLWRNDHWQIPRYDTRNGVFPATADPAVTLQFTLTMRELIHHATIYRAYADWKKVADSMKNPEELTPLARKLLRVYPDLKETYLTAHKIINAAPQSDGARVLREMLEIGREAEVLAPSFLQNLKRECARLDRKYPPAFLEITEAQCAPLGPVIRDVKKAPFPPKGLKFQRTPYLTQYKMLDIRKFHEGKDGLLYVTARLKMAKGGKRPLLIGVDGPLKVWVNRKEVGCYPKATNPAVADQYKADVVWKKGVNEIVFALDANNGRAWGIIARTPRV